MKAITLAALIAGAALAIATVVRADEFTRKGTSGATTNWKDGSKWTNVTDGADVRYPAAGDHANLMVSIDNWTYLDIQGGCGVGSMFVRNRWGHYRVRTTWVGSYNFTFDNAAQPSTVVIGHSSGSTYWGQVAFGADGASDRVTRVNLLNDLAISNDGAKPSHGRFDIGQYGSIIGGSASSRRTISIESRGGKQAMLVQSGSATFTGDWVVDGADATLDINRDSFGHASNSVRLRNGGRLDLVTLGGFVWNRDLIVEQTGGKLGIGTVFTNSTGRLVYPSDSTGLGTLVVTGGVRLENGSQLVATNALPIGTYPLITSTTTIEGRFGQTVWPADRQGLTYVLLYAPNRVDLKVYLGGAIMTLR